MESITTIFPGLCCILNNDHEVLGYKLNLEDTAGVLYTCSMTTERGDKLKEINSVESMPGVLNSLKIRAP
jgi:hypothetical protein